MPTDQVQLQAMVHVLYLSDPAGHAILKPRNPKRALHPTRSHVSKRGLDLMIYALCFLSLCTWEAIAAKIPKNPKSPSAKPP